jgi:membrane-bound serine protease (ClpP class)
MDSGIVAYALIALSLVLMLAEFFLPTGGILFVLGIGALVVGVTMSFATSTTRGMATLIIVVVIIPILGPILIHYWPRTSLGKRFVLTGTQEDDTLANMPVNLELEQLRGRYGRTVSALRPSGVTDFDGRRVDTISEGSMIEPGQWVRCIDVKSGRVIVRQVDKPPDLADMEDIVTQ